MTPAGGLHLLEDHYLRDLQAAGLRQLYQFRDAPKHVVHSFARALRSVPYCRSSLVTFETKGRVARTLTRDSSAA